VIGAFVLIGGMPKVAVDLQNGPSDPAVAGEAGVLRCEGQTLHDHRSDSGVVVTAPPAKPVVSTP
jgi:hypothetical protein